MKRYVLLLVCLLGVLLNLSAEEERYVNRWYLSESEGPYFLTDPFFTDMMESSDWEERFLNEKVQARVTFGIDDASDISFQDTEEINLDVIITYSTFTESEGLVNHTQESTLSTDINLGVVDLANSYISLDNAFNVQVSIPGGFNVLTYVPYYLEIEILVERKHLINPLTKVSAFTCSDENDDNMIHTSWSHVNNAAFYDLEYRFVSGAYINSTVNNFVAYHNLEDIAIDGNPFKSGATRVRVRQPEFVLPNVFQKGYVLFRVRPVGYINLEGQSVLYEGKWSDEAFSYSDQIPIEMENWSYEVFLSHEPKKNWQMNTTFAEDGKYSPELIYADGSSRVRQMLVRNPETGTPIVSEQKYDVNGRKVLDVLPAPTADKEFTYHELFNTQSGGSEFNYQDFDRNTNYLDVSALSSQSGSEYYYSGTGIEFAEEQSQHGFYDQLAHSEGYPFSRVIYKNDNSGRVKEQFSPGLEFKPDIDPSESHNIRHLYGRPTQAELNALFGAEVGYAKYYKKHVTIDQNGQGHVEYTDLKGNVIASGLSAISPASSILSPLSTTAAQTNSYTLDVVEEAGVQNELNFQNRTKEFEYPLLIESVQASPFTISYTLEKAKATLNCDNDPGGICYDCVYDFELLLRDSNGDEIRLLSSTGVEGNIVAKQFGESLLNDMETGIYSPNCTSLAGTYYSESGTVLDETGVQIDLQPGEYTLVKRLTLNEQALDYSIEHYLESNCVTPPIEELPDYDPCNFTCTECNEMLNNLSDPEMISTVQVYCDQICGTASSNHALGDQYIDMYKSILLNDISPGGQYGRCYNVDGDFAVADYPLSIYNYQNVNSLKDVYSYSNLYITNSTQYQYFGDVFDKQIWRYPRNYSHTSNPYHYYDLDGNIVTVPVTNLGGGEYEPAVIDAGLVSGGEIEPQYLMHVKDFIELFEPDWAESLLCYHPEYVYYLFNEAIILSHQYDREMLELSYSELTLLTNSDFYTNPLNANPNITPLPQSTSANDLLFSQDWHFELLDRDEFYQVLFTALESYLTDVDDTDYPISLPDDLTLWQYVNLITKDQSVYGCSTTPVVDGTATTISTDEAWDLFKVAYVTLKSQLLDLCMAYEAIHLSSYNGLIGTSDLYHTGMEMMYIPYGSTEPQSPSDNIRERWKVLEDEGYEPENMGIPYPSDFPITDEKQITNILNFEAYTDKEVRFPDIFQSAEMSDDYTGTVPEVFSLDITTNLDDVVVQWLGNVQADQLEFVEQQEVVSDLQVQSLCGTCPEAEATINFLDRFFQQYSSSNVYSITETDLNCEHWFRGDFGLMLQDYIPVGNGYVLQTSGAASQLTLSLDNQIGNTCSITLNMLSPESSLYDFDDVLEICCMETSDTYDFIIEGKVLCNSYDSEHNVPGIDNYRTVRIGGNTTCLNALFECENSEFRFCELTDLGQSIDDFVTRLILTEQFGTSFTDLELNPTTGYQYIEGEFLDFISSEYSFDGVWSADADLITPNQYDIDFYRGSSDEFRLSFYVPNDLTLSDVYFFAGVEVGSGMYEIYFKTGQDTEPVILSVPGEFNVISCWNSLPEEQELIELPLSEVEQTQYVYRKNPNTYLTELIFSNQDIITSEIEEILIPVGENTAEGVFNLSTLLLTSGLPDIVDEISLPEGSLGEVEYSTEYDFTSLTGLEFVSLIPDFSTVDINGRSRFAKLTYRDDNGDNYLIELKTTKPFGIFGVFQPIGGDFFTGSGDVPLASDPEYEDYFMQKLLDNLQDDCPVAFNVSENRIIEEVNLEVLMETGFGNNRWDDNVSEFIYKSHKYLDVNDVSDMDLDNIYYVQSFQDGPGVNMLEFKGLCEINPVIDGAAYDSFYVPVSIIVRNFSFEENFEWDNINLLNGDFNNDVSLLDDGDLTTSELDQLEFYTTLEYMHNCWYGGSGEFYISTIANEYSDDPIVTQSPGCPVCDQFMSVTRLTKEPRVIWQQDISVQKFTDYQFGFWVINRDLMNGLGASFLQVEVVSTSNPHTLLSNTNNLIIQDATENVVFAKDFHIKHYNDVENVWINLQSVFNTYNNEDITIRISAVAGWESATGDLFAIDDITLKRKDKTPGPSPICSFYLPYDQPAPGTPCEDFQDLLTDFNNQQAYDEYMQEQYEYAEQEIINACMGTPETLNLTIGQERQYMTLYYYDQAGNLERTVPPEGVSYVDEADFQYVESDRDAPLGGQRNYQMQHTKSTVYKYNSLNQVIASYMPDHDQLNSTLVSGDESNYSNLIWYDELGRVLVSQNTKLKEDGLAAGSHYYAYSCYDDLGRVVEAGRLHLMSNLEVSLTTALNTNPLEPEVYFQNGVIVFTNSENAQSLWRDFIHSESRSEVVYTRYDKPYSQSDVIVSQDNLRNRVSYSCVVDGVVTPANSLPDEENFTYDYLTLYSYDVHGNVKDLWKKTSFIQQNDVSLVHIHYDYDLLSGNVNEIVYQPGKSDQYYHRYEYDEANRITDVWTSRDGMKWTRDAEYYYYLHGPLARAELGHYKVQGLDYAYTLQGWLKGVNTDKTNTSYDIGQDGGEYDALSLNQHTSVSRDAYGYSLSYFDQDYSSNNNNFLTSIASATYDSEAPALYNGNIRRMMSSAYNGSPTDDLNSMMFNYKYDKLNRLVNMEGYKYGTAWSSEYHSDYTYDLDGNIQFLNRSLNPLSATDNIVYNYPNAENNRLGGVTNTGGHSVGASSYDYDGIGNLTLDTESGIEDILWTNTGKVKEVIRSIGSTNEDLEFRYDAMGNRIMKIVKPETGQETLTYYARDAQGNLLATYTGNLDEQGNPVNLVLDEYVMYGSSRLGTIDADGSPVGVEQRGMRLYELTNHLGNVRAVVSDRKIPVNGNEDAVTTYIADSELPHATQSSTYAYEGNYSSEINQANPYSQTLYIPVEHGDVISSEIFARYYDNDGVRAQIVCQLHVDNGTETGGISIPGSWSATILQCSANEFIPSYKAYTVDLQGASNGILRVYAFISSYSESVWVDNLSVDVLRGTTLVSYYQPDVVSSSEYWPFGLPLEADNPQEYRFGFQGQEKDNEWTGTEGSHLAFKYRVHDARIGRFLSVDPLAKDYPWNSPYAFSENIVINSVELEGLERVLAISYDGEGSGGTNYRIEKLEILNSGEISKMILPNNPAEHMVSAFKEASAADEHGIGFVGIFGHGNPSAQWGNNSKYFFLEDLELLDQAIKNGEIKFSENAVIFFGNCNAGTSDTGESFAQLLANITDVTVIAGSTDYYENGPYGSGGVGPLDENGEMKYTMFFPAQDNFRLFQKDQEPVDLGGTIDLRPILNYSKSLKAPEKMPTLKPQKIKTEPKSD